MYIKTIKLNIQIETGSGKKFSRRRRADSIVAMYRIIKDLVEEVTTEMLNVKAEYRPEFFSSNEEYKAWQKDNPGLK